MKRKPPVINPLMQLKARLMIVRYPGFSASAKDEAQDKIEADFAAFLNPQKPKGEK